MKLKFLFTSTLVVLSFLTSVANAKLVHLVCRGGSVGNTRLTVQQRSENSEVLVTYAFARYTGPASAISYDRSYLSPGECSWSTGIIESTYIGFVHSIDNTGLDLTVDVYPNNSHGMLQVNQGADVQIHHGRDFVDDLNRSYLPELHFSYSSISNSIGSIFDPNMIFDFAVSVISGSKLLTVSYVMSSSSL